MEVGEEVGRQVQKYPCSFVNSLYLTHLIDCIQGTQLDDQSCHTPQLVATQEI